MNMRSQERESWRIAMVWMDRSGRFMEVLQAVNRAADLAGTISLRHFPASARHFTRDVVKPTHAVSAEANVWTMWASRCAWASAVILLRQGHEGQIVAPLQAFLGK